jgi:uncharacterized RDD family membrane protein YckC
MPDALTPSVFRRMAAMAYECLVLFGVLMAAGFLYSFWSQQRNALQGRSGLQAFLFVVLGLYFVWFWSHGGQTVAMKAWRVRLVDLQGRQVSQRRALLRYLASWLWVAPALAAARVAPWHDAAALAASGLWVAVYAASSYLRPDRQFWHDALCSTRLERVAHPALPDVHNARP